jgi:hypothetical protein
MAESEPFVSVPRWLRGREVSILAGVDSAP